jgi:Phage integrase, N-terminal SAM-like domain
MTTTTPSAALVPTAPVFTNTERLALAGFLAAYSGLTRAAYELDLRQFASWCQQQHLRLFQVRRADIENFARDLEALGRARATVTRRLCTIAGFYRYAVEEELLVIPGSARPPAPPRLRVARNRTGPQRARRPAGRRWARTARGTRPDLPAGPERAAGLRGHWRRHRGPGHRARSPDSGDHPQGRQGCYHSARATYGTGDRPCRR